VTAETETHLAGLAARDAVMAALGIDLVEATVGRVVVAVTVRGQHLNFNGTCHGGVIFSLADSAFGLASNARDSMAAGISAHIAYTAPAREGDRLTATAREIALSSRLATYQVEVTNGDGRVIASFTGTVFVTGRGHGEVASPS
jgi:acyl-CoA thioesterase